MPNWLEEDGAANGANPALKAGADTDTNVGVDIAAVGTGAVRLTTNNADYPTFVGGTGTVTEGIGGSSTNVSRAINAKGTGTVSTDNAVIAHAVNALAYGATVTPDANLGLLQQLSLASGNTGAMAFAAPANAPASNRCKEMIVEILNNSGGAMGTITWNAAYILVGGAFTNPANTKRRFIRFFWNGSEWVESSRASADY